MRGATGRTEQNQKRKEKKQLEKNAESLKEKRLVLRENLGKEKLYEENVNVLNDKYLQLKPGETDSGFLQPMLRHYQV